MEDGSDMTIQDIESEQSLMKGYMKLPI